MCDETPDLTFDTSFKINVSLTTCIECVLRGEVQKEAQWFDPSGKQLVSGQNGVVIENGTLIVIDADLFLTGPRVPPFILNCTSPNGQTTLDVCLAGKLALPCH